MTLPERIRHDPGVEVDDGSALPEALAAGGLELLESPAGLWAMVDMPARDTAGGYRDIMDGWFQGPPGFVMESDPFLERRAVAPEDTVVVTVCVRVHPIGQDGEFNMAVLDPGPPRA